MSKAKTPDNERKLTPREQARLATFDALRADMAQKGFVEKDLTFDLAEATLKMTLLPLPFAAVIVGAYFAVHPWDFGIFGSGSFAAAYLQGILITIALVFAHELIHGLTWSLFAKHHLKSISFGIILEQLTPYCTCAEPLAKWPYILGAAMPTVVIGGVLAAMAIATGSLLQLAICVIMVFAGGGDMLVIAKILRWKPTGRDVRYCDHPTNVGLIAFER